MKVVTLGRLSIKEKTLTQIARVHIGCYGWVMHCQCHRGTGHSVSGQGTKGHWKTEKSDVSILLS